MKNNNNIFINSARMAAFYRLIALTLLIFLIASANVMAQCPSPTYGSSSSGCNGGTYTLAVTNTGISTSITSLSHKWYTTQTGGSPFTTTTATNPTSGVWTSQYQASLSSSTTYWVSSYCNGSESSSRTAVTFTLTTPGNLSISTGGNPPYICIGNSITLTPQGGSNYSWSSSPAGASGSGAITVSPTVNTTYTLSGTESVCNTARTTSIPISVSPKVGQVSTPSGTTSLCQGSVATSTYTASATNVSSYTWSITPTSPVSAGTVSSTGVVTWNSAFSGTATMTVTAYSGSSCNYTTTASQNVAVIPMPGAPTVSNPPTALFGSTVTLTASGAASGETYRWYDPSASLTSNVVWTQSLTAPSTTYTVSRYNSTPPGCETPSGQRVSQTISLYVDPPPSPSISSNTCGTRTLTLPAPPSGVTYYWQGTDPNLQSTATAINPSYTLTASGTYYLRAKVNSMTLWSTATSFSVTVINPATPSAPTATINTCGAKILSRGTPSDGSTWYWQGTNSTGTDMSGTASANTFSAAASGTYYLRAYLSGCWSAASSISVSVTNPATPSAPTVSANSCGPKTLSKGTPSDGSTWYWQGTNSAGTDQSAGAAAATYSVTTSGTYYLRAYLSGCWSSSSSLAVTIIDPGAPSSVPTVSTNTCGAKTLTRGTPSDGTTWYWQGTDPNGQDQSGTASATTYQAVNPGTANYYLRAYLSGCWSPATGVSVTVNNPAPPPVPIVPTATCGFKTITKGTPPGGVGYYWQGTSSSSQDYSSPVATASVYQVTVGNTYYLGARDAANCWAYTPIVVAVFPVDLAVTTYDNVNPLVQATHQVKLLPGFSVPAGSTLTVKIAITPECNDYINWTEQIVYNEAATPLPVRDSRTYYDGLGKDRLSESKDFLNNKVWASQSIYDRYGTASAATLSAPILENDFIFKDNFAQNSNNQPYSYNDFDKPIATGAAGEVYNPIAMGKLPGTVGWYYSSNNNLEPNTAVTDYPYARSFTPEGPNPTTSKSAGTGDQYKMGSNHEVTGDRQAITNELDNYYILRQYFISTPNWSNPNLLNVTTSTTANFTANGSASIGSAANYLSVNCTGTTAKSGVLIGTPVTVTPGKLYRLTVRGYRSIGSTSNVNLYVASGSDIVWPGALLPVANATSTNENWVSSVFTVPAGITSIQLGVLWSQPTSGHSFSLSAVDLRAELPVTSPGYKFISTDPDGKKAVSFVDADGRSVASAILTGSTFDYWSYNYYNDLGQLVASVAPNGVTGTSASPNFVTKYKYDHLGQLIESNGPEEGTSQFLYSTDGKIRFSQNEEQRTVNTAHLYQSFSYTNYDTLGRLVESGEYTSNSTLSGTNYNFESVTNTGSVPANTVKSAAILDLNGLFVTPITSTATSQAGRCTDYTLIRYDFPAGDCPGGTTAQTNVLGQVSRTRNANATTWYSYDEFGRLVKSWQKINMMSDTTNASNAVKTIDYTYDYFGNVITVAYQAGKADNFYHHYEYDIDNRLTKVNTSFDGVNKTPRASYYYYLHGPLKRVEYESNLQGIDYVYNIDGSLKLINHPDPTRDPGYDGISGVNAGFMKDIFGEALDYNMNDYTGAGYDEGNATAPAAYTDKFSGTLKAVRWHSPADNHNPQAYAFTYDNVNQMDNADWGNVTWSAGSYQVATSPNYKEDVGSYDKNGNIIGLTRTGKSGNSLANYAYNYTTNTNKLSQVTTGGTNITYLYNTIGQMIQQTEGTNVMKVKYNAYGLVKEIRNGSDKLLLVYTYDDRGNKIVKTSYDPSGTNPALKNTYYIYDVSGNILAVYDQRIPASPAIPFMPKLIEVPIYGAGRIAVHKPLVSTTFYEVSDHLGNVRGVIGKAETLVYTATVEDNGQAVYTNPRVQELAYFKNLSATGKVDVNMNHTAPSTAMPSPTYSAYLKWVSGMAGQDAPQKSVGPAIGLKVEPGDKIDIETYVKYKKKATYSRSGIAGAMASILGNDFAGTATGIDVVSTATSVFTNGLSYAVGTAVGNGNDGSTLPFAYVYYLLFDKSFTPITQGWSRVTTAGGFDAGNEAISTHEKLSISQLTVPASGYIYIFVSNESENTEVWFDDLKITHQKSSVVAGADYYPFGLAMENREITREPYRFGYQGQFSEKDLTTGMQEFELRLYDPRIGRWTTMDPYGIGSSPYIGMGNNPGMLSDPDGGCPCPVAFEVWGAAVEFASKGGMTALNASVLRAASVSVKFVTWYGNDIGNFLTSKRILNETEKGFLGATKLAASINIGYSGIDTGWKGGYDDTALKAGQGMSVMTVGYTMGGGGYSTGGSPVYSTSNGSLSINSPYSPTLKITDSNGIVNAGGESSSTKKGREEHKNYNPGPDYTTNPAQNRLPSGKIPDAIDVKNQIVRELKPNNPKKFRQYIKQVRGYRDELQKIHGGKWKWNIDFYSNGF